MEKFFQEDGSFRLQDLYVENHRIVASEDEVTDKTIVDAAGLRCFRAGGYSQSRCIWT